uniref:Uncharacterized protein n=1 Tax=Oryza punctata TaxID=4537 RepID=A0A0E0KQH6_ORYPU
MVTAPLPNSPNEETAAGTFCGHAAAVLLCHEVVAVDTCVPEEVENAAGNGTVAAAAASGEQPGAVARREQVAASDEAAASSEPGVVARGEQGAASDEEAAASGEPGVAPVELLRGARGGAGGGGGGRGACAPSRCRTTAVQPATPTTTGGGGDASRAQVRVAPSMAPRRHREPEPQLVLPPAGSHSEARRQWRCSETTRAPPQERRGGRCTCGLRRPSLARFSAVQCSACFKLSSIWRLL